MTTGVKNKLSRVNSFVDEAFSTSSNSEYRLIILLGTDGLKAAVYDKQSNKFIAFEYFSFQNAFRPDVVAELFSSAAKESAIISHKYRNVTCVIENNLSTLVPEALYEADRKSMYLKFNSKLEGDELILEDRLSSLEARNIFALPFAVKAAVDSMFSNVKYHHYSSPLIEGLMIQSKNITKKQIFVHVQATHFEVTVTEGKKLLFYNSFNHHSPEDFMYYLLFVFEQLHLNPETSELQLLGEIERSSSIFNLLQKYVRNIKFGARADEADLSYQLQTLPRNYYFNVLNSYFTK
jgi:hypothetical protein